MEPLSPFQPVNPAPGTPAGGPQPEPSRRRAISVWVSVAVLLVLIAAGAWYYYAYYYAPRSGEGLSPSSAPAVGVLGDQQTQALETQGTSDDIGAIEQDLKATDLGDLDRELSDIEAQLAQ